MIKKFIMITFLSLLSSFSFAQSSIDQKTFLVHPSDKPKVHDFQDSVKIKIDKHRTEMRARKEVLEREKESLRTEIRVARKESHGKLSDEKKNQFKTRIDTIEAKSLALRKENEEFMSQIDKEREQVFSSIKNKKQN